MRRFLAALGRQLQLTWASPRRLLGWLDRRRRRKSVQRFWQEVRYGSSWQPAGGSDLRQRSYDSYDAYLDHQRSKLGQIGPELADYDERFYAALLARLHSLDPAWHGRRVLCLGARQGSEVRAFIAAGAFAVGVDLNPGSDNPYVVRGDFHRLQFADGTLDVVFTNSLDHALDLDRVLSEVRRLLRPGGWFIAEAAAGEEAKPAGPFETLWWNSVDDLAAAITARGFELAGRHPFELPWLGQQMLFRRVDPAADAGSS